MPFTIYHNVFSNIVRVRDAKACGDILDEYECSLDFDIELRQSKDGTSGVLQLSGQETWPRVVKCDDIPDIDDDLVEWMEVMDRNGDQGFLDLLVRLSPFIETPMVIQALALFGFDFIAAQEWVLRPGAKEVETRRIESLDEGGDRGVDIEVDEDTKDENADTPPAAVMAEQVGHG